MSERVGAPTTRRAPVPGDDWTLLLGCHLQPVHLSDNLSNDGAEWWYAQNILLFVRRAYLSRHLRLKQEYNFAGTSQLSLVHSKRYTEWVEWALSHRETP